MIEYEKVITAGIPKSASSFLTQVIGVAFKISRDKNEKFNKFVQMEQTEDDIIKGLRAPGISIIKTHHHITESITKVAKEKNSLIFATVRHPMEVALSHFDHSRRNWASHPDNPPHPNAKTLLESCKAVKGSWMIRFNSYTSNEAVHVVSYEEIFERNNYVNRILGVLGVQDLNSPVLGFLENIKIWQFNLGKKNRLRDLDNETLDMLSREFAEEAELYDKFYKQREDSLLNC